MTNACETLASARRAWIAAALVAAVLGAPGAAARDERLATRLYQSEEVVRLEGRMGVQATITFGEDEHIENVAVGDSAAWQITPNKRANLLFVKPLNAKARTNMTVVTDRHTYYFDLIAGAAAKPLYGLRFTYPPGEKPDLPNVTQTALNAAERGSIASEAEAKPIDPSQLNFAWAAKGKSALLPTRVFDDGLATFLAWPVGMPVPAMLVRNERGEEGPVNYAVRDDVIVIDGVPRLILLRAGKDSATLENRGPARRPGPTPALAAAPPPQEP